MTIRDVVTAASNDLLTELKKAEDSGNVQAIVVLAVTTKDNSEKVVSSWAGPTSLGLYGLEIVRKNILDKVVTE